MTGFQFFGSLDVKLYFCHLRRLEESEKKRQAMMQAMKDQASKKGPNFVITKKDLQVNKQHFFD